MFFEPKNICFSSLKNEDIEKMSVVEITTNKVYDDLNDPVPNGFCDGKMGLTNGFKMGKCISCNKKFNECNGHFGNIKLNDMILNPLFTGYLKKFSFGINFSKQSSNEKSKPDLNKYSCLTII